ncbi:U-box domain-containing 2 -like protein [Gossypium arboreum]|uniref:RING-type E3 ubiquitin transferase n=1 Tax=Gossypium arboreum TaxID=29729 RepID=A0A0B0NR85_GOSAR|nr:U-box domain-containing protein 4-like [Gossypium arboreum]XP_052879630.1 U-box domain-containing protein 4-like [Gossypium arboreum]KHG13616.1 U-box domain-containing 2 -like protein [Gossypium arboreum]
MSLLETLLRDISSFLNLSSSENINSEPVQKYYQGAEEILKVLKPIILNAIFDSEITSDEVLSKEFKELGVSVEELLQQFERWQPLSSKAYFVLQVESLISEIRNSCLDIFRVLKSSHQHLPYELSSASLELHLQKIKHVGYEQTSSVIKEAKRDQVGNFGPSSEILLRIAESLSLNSNMEVLIEAVALEKLKENTAQAEKLAEVDCIDQLIALITNMHHCLFLKKQSPTCSSVPTPLDFICPLSLELMTDPVIVASGQTYERSFIKKWFDLGLTVCPKTWQTLVHTLFIPNYTMKALIANWCELNNVKLPNLVESTLNQVYPPRATKVKKLVEDLKSKSNNVKLPDLVESTLNQVYPPRVSKVKKLVEDLKSTSTDTQRVATAQLRLLAKQNRDNRIIIANCGAIILLVDLLNSPDTKTQENSVTALLNLSNIDNNKTAIADANAIEPLIHVLKTGSPEAKENSAATLFSLSVIEDNKVRIGRSGAIRPLVDLLGNGTPRGKKDAATALFNLSIFHENKARIVKAGAVRYLVHLMHPAAGMVDKAVAVLASLATTFEGRTAIGQEGGIPLLVEVVELGSARGKANATAALLQLCTNSSRFCMMVLQEGAVPPLVALSQSGTQRAKEKAQALLSYFQRHYRIFRSI